MIPPSGGGFAGPAERGVSALQGIARKGLFAAMPDAETNYLKSVAPKVAAAIRAAVNDHPVLSKIIQFNGIPAIAAANAAGAGAAGYRLVPVDHDPFAQ